MKQQIRWYLEDVITFHLPENTKNQKQIYKKLSVVLYIFVYNCAHLLFKMYSNMDPFNRLLNFDITYLFDCAPFLNVFTLTYVFHGAVFIFVNYQLVLTHPKTVFPLTLVYKTIFSSNNSYFLKANYKSKLSKKIRKVDDFVRLVNGLYRRAYYYIFEFITAIFVVLYLKMCQTAISAGENREYFFGSITGLVAFLLMSANALSLYLCNMWLILVDGIVSMIALALVTIFFIRLSQIGQLLKRNSVRRRLSEAKLRSFFLFTLKPFFTFST